MSRHFSPALFTAAFCLAYVTVLAADLPLFLYYPQERLFAWAWSPLTEAGPSMAWYGLMAVALPVAAALAAIVPGRWIGAAARLWFWGFPLGAMAGCVYLMSPFFIR